MDKGSGFVKIEGRSIVFYSDLTAEEICPDLGFVHMNSPENKQGAMREKLFSGYKPTGGGFNNQSKSVQEAEIIIVRGSVGTGNHQNRAAEALKAGGIKVVIANGFERRFWDFCGHKDIERVYLLSQEDLEDLCSLTGDVTLSIDMRTSIVTATNEFGASQYQFSL